MSSISKWEPWCWDFSHYHMSGGWSRYVYKFAKKNYASPVQKWWRVTSWRSDWAGRLKLHDYLLTRWQQAVVIVRLTCHERPSHTSTSIITLCGLSIPPLCGEVGNNELNVFVTFRPLLCRPSARWTTRIGHVLLIWSYVSLPLDRMYILKCVISDDLVNRHFNVGLPLFLSCYHRGAWFEFFITFIARITISGRSNEKKLETRYLLLALSFLTSGFVCPLKAVLFAALVTGTICCTASKLHR